MNATKMLEFALNDEQPAGKAWLERYEATRHQEQAAVVDEGELVRLATEASYWHDNPYGNGNGIPLHKYRAAAIIEAIRPYLRTPQPARPDDCGRGDELPDGALPERDHSKPTEQQGVFRKFEVRRVDGSDQPGGKHHGCEYFVLDVVHDRHAKAALNAYVLSCQLSHPDLAKDMAARYGLKPYDRIDQLAEALKEIDELKAAMQAQPQADWKEDAAHENGNYQCKCSECGASFIGHKRRVLCKQCAQPQPQDDVWQPIETAPKDLEHGIIARRGHFVFWTDWDDEDGWFTQNQFYEKSYYAEKFAGDTKWRPTHWMPIDMLAKHRKAESDGV